MVVEGPETAAWTPDLVAFPLGWLRAAIPIRNSISAPIRSSIHSSTSPVTSP